MTSSSSPVLVALGDNCLDVYLSRDFVTVGGNALNVAAQWRRAGGQARYFGAVGHDPEGDLVLQEAAAAALEPADIERRPGDTAVTLLLDDAGDRRFLLEVFGVGEHYMPSADRYAIAAGADWLHLGTNPNPDLVRRLVADRVQFSVDLSTSHFALPLQGVPLVFASGPDSEPVDGLIEALRDAGARQVVVTCGKSGAHFHDGQRARHVSAMPVDVVDTCGAGDSFIATFLAALKIEHLPPETALAKAAVAAAYTCTHLGSIPQEPRPIPDWLPIKYADIINAEQAS